MKRIFVYLNTIIIVCFWIPLVYGGDQTLKNDLQGFKEPLLSRISLINEIIRNPNAASMKNWTQLGNPHDEIELIFYMNSISDGTTSAYSRNSKTMEKLTRHSKSISQDEPSLVLQYLRLSLLAYNKRPASEPPEIKLLSVNQGKENEVVADCYLKASDLSGHYIQIPTKVVFELGDIPSRGKTVNQVRLYLQKIYVSDRMVYGWWQK
jgi:hypothetical protein